LPGNDARFHRFHLLDRVHPLDNLAEYGVTPAVEGGIVERSVVFEVDVELRGRRVRILCASHREGRSLVLQAVLGLVFNGRTRGFLAHVGCNAAALHDKAANDAVEDGVVVVARIDVAQKVGDGLRCFGRIELDDKCANAGFDPNFRVAAVGGCRLHRETQ